MSYQTGAVLDGLDPQLLAIQRKLFMGQPLTNQESQRLSRRHAVEQETARTGGTVKEGVYGQASQQDPRAAGGRQAGGAMTPKQAGARDARQAMDYIEGRDSVLSAPARPEMSPTGQPKTRRSNITNDASVEDKIADNQRGPHMGEDGLPATWRVPQTVVGSDGAAPPDYSTGPSSIRMQGKDGMWKVWKNGKFENEDAPAPAAPSGAPAAPTTSAAPTAPAAAARTIQEDEAYIRQAGFGDFVDRARAQDQAPAAAGGSPSRPSVDPVQAAGRAWMGMGSQAYPGTKPAAPAAAAASAPMGLPSAEAVAAAVVPTAMGPTAQSMFENATKPKAQAPIMPAAPAAPKAQAKPEIRPPGEPFNLYAMGPGTPGPEVTGSRGPMFPNAIWNAKPRPLTTNSRAFQATADRFNPFAQNRRTSVLPE